MDRNSIAVKIFDDLADKYQQKYMDVSLYADTVDTFCKLIPQMGATVLELACGPGNMTRCLLEKRPDLQVLGTDNSPNMLEFAIKNNPLVHFQRIDSRNISGLSRKFDAVLCAFLLPFLEMEEAEKLIRDIHSLLNNNGILYLSTMEDEPSKSGWKYPSDGGAGDIYMTYYKEGTLTRMFDKAGFSIVATERKLQPQQTGTDERDLIIIARKNNGKEKL